MPPTSTRRCATGSPAIRASPSALPRPRVPGPTRSEGGSPNSPGNGSNTASSPRSPVTLTTRPCSTHAANAQHHPPLGSASQRANARDRRGVVLPAAEHRRRSGGPWRSGTTPRNRSAVRRPRRAYARAALAEVLGVPRQGHLARGECLSELYRETGFVIGAWPSDTGPPAAIQPRAADNGALERQEPREVSNRWARRAGQRHGADWRLALAGIDEPRNGSPLFHHSR
jgi:hypothetical protein